MIIKKANIIRLKKARSLCLAFFSLFLCQSLFAQNVTVSPVHDNTEEVNRTAVETEHSAKKALILSAILPGAGQVYNKQAWKIPIIYAAFGGVSYFTYTNYTQMKLHKEEYLYRVNNDGAFLHSEFSNKPTSNIYNLYEAYNKTFQLSIIITVAIYGLNLLDAYIFGHLFDFQISDDLSLNMMPAALTSFGQQRPCVFPGAVISLSF